MKPIFYRRNRRLSLRETEKNAGFAKIGFENRPKENHYMNENRKASTPLLTYEPPQLEVFEFNPEEILLTSTNPANAGAPFNAPYNPGGDDPGY